MATFGAELKRERERQGVTLEEISLSTKIGTRMLRALEEEHFEQLPGGIFNKGFIRAYARCLGMDEDQVVADYLAATGATPVARKSEVNDPAPILEPPPRDEPAAALPWGAFAVVLLIVALGFAAWGFYSRESEPATQQPASPAASSSGASPAATESAPSVEKPPEPADTSAPSPQQQPGAVNSVGAPTQSPAASAPASVSSEARPQPTAPANSPLQLVIRAREDSWLAVSVDGEIVTRALLTAPAQRSIRAQNEIVVRAGNVGALDFEFNGNKLPTQGDFGEAKTLIFNAHGLQASAPKAEAPKPDATKPDTTQPNVATQPPQ